MNPQFSIVTASFNYGRFIRECLASVQAQQGVTWEHIVVDGGSKDETLKILGAHPHLRVVAEPDEGMSDAINKGFNLARGDWVMWLNADDRLKPGALAEVARCAARHRKADVIYGSFDFVDAGGRLLRRMRLLPFCWFVLVHYGCYVPSTAAFYRKATVLDQGFRLDKRFRIVMDEEFYARLAQNGKRFHYLPVWLADFRLHETNQSFRTLHGQRTVDSEWKASLHAAEGETVTRTYGFTPFRRRAFNHGSDCVFYIAAWGLKGLLKLPFWLCIREPATRNASARRAYAQTSS
jgi:glycosyltransferase involved in cell wall biosynthesis